MMETAVYNNRLLIKHSFFILMNISAKNTVHVIVSSVADFTEKSLHHVQEKKRTSALDTVNQYTFWKDQLRTEVGIVLTEHLLLSAGISEATLHTIVRNNFGRPLLLSHTFDFNVSHSGEYVVAVCSPINYIGIDIEQNRAIEIAPYESVFHSKEWGLLKNSPNIFFELWTKKESLLKAKGVGFQEDLMKVNIFEKQTWPDGSIAQPYFHKVDIPDYTCFICSTFPCDQIEISYCHTESELLSLI